MHKKMILITNLDVWLLSSTVKTLGAGNQSLYNTLLGYARVGWEVHMLTNCVVLSHAPTIHKNIIIHRKPMFTSLVFRILKPLIKRLLGVPKPSAVPKTVSTSTRPYAFKDWLYAQVFRHVMSQEAIKIAEQLGGVDFIYGYEIQGALAGKEAARKLCVPLVNRFQGTELGQWLEQPEKLLSYKTWVEATKIEADLIIMANDGTFGDRVLDFLGTPKEKYRFYMNGVVKEDVYRPNVDIAQIREKAGVPAGNLFLLYTGRFFHWKRVDRLLEVFAKASQEYCDATLVLIGDGPERTACEQLVNHLGIADEVVFLDPLPHSEVMDYLNACDIYVAFTDLSNLSNAMIEACVCGKCIVTTNVRGTTDLLTDGVNAVVVDKHDDVDAITAALMKVMKADVERSRLEKGARQRGAELMTWKERMQMETDEVTTMLAKKSGG